jgi:hypothetical protein
VGAAGKEGELESLKIEPIGKGCTVSAKTSEGTLNLDLQPVKRLVAK